MHALDAKKKLKSMLRGLDKRFKACKAVQQVKPESLFFELLGGSYEQGRTY